MIDPGDYSVDRPGDPGLHPLLPMTRAFAVSPRRTVSTASRHRSLILSPTQDVVRQTVLRFGQASASQLRLLHYQGTERGTRARASRHLKALSERGFIRRIPFRLSGYGMGSGEYIYCPPDSNARTPNLHTLDITELFLQLSLRVDGLQFDPEPWVHITYGGHKVTPDAYVRIGARHYWVEIDRSSESPSVISAKMNRYVTAFRSLDGGTFPQVIWIAHTPDRVRTLEREAKKKGEPGLFVCMLFDDATERILQ